MFDGNLFQFFSLAFSVLLVFLPSLLSSIVISKCQIYINIDFERERELLVLGLKLNLESVKCGLSSCEFVTMWEWDNEKKKKMSTRDLVGWPDLTINVLTRLWHEPDYAQP